MPQKSSNQILLFFKFYNKLRAKRIPLNTSSAGILNYQVIKSASNHYFIKTKPPVHTPLDSW